MAKLLCFHEKTFTAQSAPPWCRQNIVSGFVFDRRRTRRSIANAARRKTDEARPTAASERVDRAAQTRRFVRPRRRAVGAQHGIAIGLRASAPHPRCRSAKPRFGADSQLSGSRREAKDCQRKALYLAHTSAFVSASGKN